MVAPANTVTDFNSLFIYTSPVVINKNQTLIDEYYKMMTRGAGAFGTFVQLLHRERKWLRAKRFVAQVIDAD